MISNYYLNKLAEKAKTNNYARWRLGELLHEATEKGYTVIQDKNTGVIELKKKEVISCN